MPKLEPYHKTLPYSYALGIYPSMELLSSRPESVTRLLLHPNSLDSQGVSLLRRKCEELGIREEFAERVLEREAKKENCYAGLVFHKYNAALDADTPHVVLMNISDSGNAGTIIRSCLGFGIKNLAIVRPAVDLFDPRTLRASMGAAFKINFRYYDIFDEYAGEHPDQKLYPFMLDGAIPLNEAAAKKQHPYSLIFGNEATGLPTEFAKFGQSVLIPQSDAIDSLNLSVAASIGIYAFTTK